MDDLLKFLIEIKDPLDLLLKTIQVLFGTGIIGAILVLIYRFAAWLYREWRIRQFRADPDQVFPFDVVKPNGAVLRALLDPDSPNDPLPPSRVPYHTHIAGKDVQHELETLLNDQRWILILGRTGLGKSRQAAELAQRLNRKGWTVLNLTHTELVSEPAKFPSRIGAERRLLFILDDLNKKMRRGATNAPPDQAIRPSKSRRRCKSDLDECSMPTKNSAAMRTKSASSQPRATKGSATNPTSRASGKN